MGTHTRRIGEAYNQSCNKSLIYTSRNIPILTHALTYMHTSKQPIVDFAPMLSGVFSPKKWQRRKT